MNMANNTSETRLVSSQLVPVLMVVIATFFTWWMVQIANFPPLVQTLVFAGLCAATLLKQRWIMYAAISMMIFAISNEWRGGQGPHLIASDILLVVVLMGYAIFSLRFTDLKFRFRLRESGQTMKTPTGTDEAITWVSTRPFSAGLILVPLALFAAILTLWIIPLDPTTDFRMRITPTGFRSIAMLWLLAFIWFLLTGLFWLIAERDRDPACARVFARSHFCRHLKRELHGIEKRRVKQRKKLEKHQG